MKRIDTAGRAVDLFGPGKPGFKDGNPLTGDPATGLNAEMFNHLQEEIARTIEAGGVALDGANYGQMAAVLGLGTRSHVANGYQKLPGGLLLQWGSILYGSTTAGATYTTPITFPLAFTAAVYHIGPAAQTNAPGSVAVSYGGVSVTGATIYTFTGAVYANLPITWLAIGK